MSASASTAKANRILITALLIGIQAAAGCSGSQDKPKTTPASRPEIEKEVRPAPTMLDWRNALESTYEIRGPKDDENGQTKFIACFNSIESKCKVHAFGLHDSFRKLRTFTPGLMSEAAVGTTVISYVSILDGGAPYIVLAPQIFSSKGWIYITKCAFMVDGVVILELDLTKHKVRRDVYPGGVEERADIVLTPEQNKELLKITPKSKITIRISGDKGYTTIDKSYTGSIKAELISLTRIHTEISNAVFSKLVDQ